MKINTVIFIIISVFALSSFLKGKGVKMISISKQFDTNRPLTTKSVLYLEEDKLKIDISNSLHNTSLIYNSAEENLWIIDHRKKLLLHLNKRTLRQLRNNRSAFDHNLTQIWNTIENTNRINSDSNIVNPLPLAPAYYVKKADLSMINGWECMKYEGYEGQQVIHELWTTSFKNLNLSNKDMRILKKFSKFIKHVPYEFIQNFETYKLPEKNTDEFAVSSRSIKGGQVVAIHNLEKVEKTNLSPSIFEVPTYRQIGTGNVTRN